MDLRDAIRSTGAVRTFRDEPVDRELLAAVLDDARFAPSGGNRQPWRVVAVEDLDTRRALAALMQPVWDEYRAASAEGQVPFNSVAYRGVDSPPHSPNQLLDSIDSIPLVLVVAADLTKIVATDAELDRAAIVPGASIYPFCWNILLAARAHDLGGVMTTFLARAESDAGRLLALPPNHAIAAVLFVGHPAHQPTKLRRDDVASFATVDRFDGPPL
jgi:nitroreductase